MKTPLLLLGLVLLALLALSGHGAHHRHSTRGRAPQLRPPRVVRSPAAAQQHRQVRAVR